MTAQFGVGFLFGAKSPRKLWVIAIPGMPYTHRKAATTKGVSFLRLPSRRAGTGSDPAKREKDLLPLGCGRSRFLSRQAGFEMTPSSIVWNAPTPKPL